jgi:hypothetical protein
MQVLVSAMSHKVLHIYLQLVLRFLHYRLVISLGESFINTTTNLNMFILWATQNYVWNQTYIGRRKGWKWKITSTAYVWLAYVHFLLTEWLTQNYTSNQIGWKVNILLIVRANMAEIEERIYVWQGIFTSIHFAVRNICTCCLTSHTSVTWYPCGRAPNIYKNPYPNYWCIPKKLPQFTQWQD